MNNIPKTEETLKLERDIFNTTAKQGVFGIFEMTVGWFGKERVDYITYDTNGIWRCYEVKVSKADFYSKCKKTFIGHYNYYVMPKVLYEEVKQDIPNEIGVYCGEQLIKRAKKQSLKVDEKILKDSMIRSLAREFQKQYKSGDVSVLEYKDRQIRRLETERNSYRKKYQELQNRIYEKYGTRWDKEK